MALRVSPRCSGEILNVTPKDNFDSSSAAINAAIEKAELTQEQFRKGRKPIEKLELFFPSEEPSSSVFVGIATALGSATISEVAVRTMQKGTEKLGPDAYSAPLKGLYQSRDPGVGAKDVVDSLNIGKKSALGALFAGVTAAIVVRRYVQFANGLRTSIEDVFTVLADREANLNLLVQRIEDVTRVQNASYFREIFNYFNVTPNGCLRLAQGIAYDSQLQGELAQEKYRQILETPCDAQFHHLVRLVFARSLRLQGNAEGEQEQINQIPEGSPLHVVNGLLVQPVDNPAVFDPDGIPYDFVCRFTFDVMHDPAGYDFDGHRHRFERSAIEDWVERNHTCPLTDRPISLEDIQADPDLKIAIRAWNQIQLKRQGE